MPELQPHFLAVLLAGRTEPVRRLRSSGSSAALLPDFVLAISGQTFAPTPLCVLIAVTFACCCEAIALFSPREFARFSRIDPRAGFVFRCRLSWCGGPWSIASPFSACAQSGRRSAGRSAQAVADVAKPAAGTDC